VRRVLLGEPLSIESTRSRQKKFPEFIGETVAGQLPRSAVRLLCFVICRVVLSDSTADKAQVRFVS